MASNKLLKMNNRCKNCNGWISNGFEFCPKCGTPIVKEEVNIEDVIYIARLEPKENSARLQYIFHGGIPSINGKKNDNILVYSNPKYELRCSDEDIEAFISEHLNDLEVFNLLNGTSIYINKNVNTDNLELRCSYTLDSDEGISSFNVEIVLGDDKEEITDWYFNFDPSKSFKKDESINTNALILVQFDEILSMLVERFCTLPKIHFENNYDNAFLPNFLELLVTDIIENFKKKSPEDYAAAMLKFQLEDK